MRVFLSVDVALALVVPFARVEAHHRLGRDAKHAQHHRHRRGVVLAISTLVLEQHVIDDIDALIGQAHGNVVGDGLAKI
jgi:hypothetical protein